MKLNQIHNIDCLEGMKQLDSNSIDTIITDPPYGLQFMGKKWDYDIPSKEHFEEMLRVAKHGATLLCFGGTRTWHRIAVNIEDAGWTIKDSIAWMYGSGFPKATDISKQLDKKAGAEREIIGKSNRIIAENPKATDYQGTTTFAETAEGREASKYITAPSTPEAQTWNGWKSHGLKPSFEPIILAMKPNDGSYAENALKWGVSGLNIDGSRIGTEEKLLGSSTGRADIRGGNYASYKGNTFDLPLYQQHQSGRFPANTILGCSCEFEHEKGCPVKILDEQSGVSKGTDNIRKNNVGWGTNGIYGKGDAQDSYGFADTGTASRFFYTAKASKSERNEGCEELPLGEPPASARTKPAEGRQNPLGNPRANFHPTVKPLALMEYLCKLTKTPTGGIVLDPYAGSGTTLIAARKTNRQFIGFEIEPDYVKIANARLKPYMEQQKLL